MRNAGGFWNGLPQLADFPAEVLTEAWAKRAAIPALILEHVPALIETLNIAAVSTLLGALMAMSLARQRPEQVRLSPSESLLSNVLLHPMIQIGQSYLIKVSHKFLLLFQRANFVCK